MSISGAQEKFSLKQEKNTLALTVGGATHILKPVPNERLRRVTDLPANEHLSMQLASQVFGIRTAACGMIFFDDGSPAYLTRRFDRTASGSKYQVEDLATLLGRTPERAGNAYKYNASYLDIANLIQKYSAASPVVLLDFFRILIFNYLIANGDAHLKNFALMETTQGDFVLTPAFDLQCTALHLDDSPLALQGGLYPGDYEEKTFYDLGMYTGASFLAFADKAGISAAAAAETLGEVLHAAQDAEQLVARSFLSAEAKTAYMAIFARRRELLEMR